MAVIDQTIRPPNGPKLTTVDVDTPIEEIANVLKRDGGVIIRNLIPMEPLKQIRAEIEKVQISSAEEENSFFDPNTARAYNLVENCPTYAPTILTNKVLLGVVNNVITSRYSYWAGERRHAVSYPQLSTHSALIIGPGAKAQDFHRDDMCWHQVHEAATEYKDGRDMQVSALFAASRATFENGATRVIPGSHLWDSEREPKWEDGVAFAEMEPGSGFLFLGSVYHAGGHNQTKDDWRYLFGASFIRGHYRQEENQYLAVKREVVAKLSHDIQDLLGYSISLPYCGFVALDEPSKLLRGGDFVAKDLY